MGTLYNRKSQKPNANTFARTAPKRRSSCGSASKADKCAGISSVGNMVSEGTSWTSTVRSCVLPSRWMVQLMIARKEYEGTPDGRRQMDIEKHGIRFLRFTDDQIHRNMDNVVKAIEEEVRRLRPGG